jgi:hypothetical protein
LIWSSCGPCVISQQHSNSQLEYETAALGEMAAADQLVDPLAVAAKRRDALASALMLSPSPLLLAPSRPPTLEPSMARRPGGRRGLACGL